MGLCPVQYLLFAGSPDCLLADFPSSLKILQPNVEGSEYARIYDYLRLQSDVTAEPRRVWYSRAPVPLVCHAILTCFIWQLTIGKIYCTLEPSHFPRSRSSSFLANSCTWATFTFPPDKWDAIFIWQVDQLKSLPIHLHRQGVCARKKQKSDEWF